MIQWLKRILSSKKAQLPKNQEEQQIVDLIHSLRKKIDMSSIDFNLENKIKAFEFHSLQKKIETLPETYLFLEKYITTETLDSESLREKIQHKYPFLKQYRSFELIFHPVDEQELILCKIFLLRVLQRSSELIGNFNDPNIIAIKTYLESAYDFNAIDVIKERKSLLDFSNEIYSKIKGSLGINAITNIYLNIYKKYFQSYHLLESFTSILNVIPEEILSKDLITFPSKQQMLKMLQKQLFSLEQINERLTEEIIEKKKVEEELKQSEHLKTIILETAMDGTILTNSQGTVLNWNKQAENILELKREETIGKSIYSLVPYKLRQQLRNSFDNYIATGDDDLINKRVETSVNRRDGSIVYIELTIVAIETKDDYLFNAFFRDITNKKIIDNEIREAKVMAEKSAKAKSVFLSNMSHEIRTPLNVILGLTGILQKSDFTNPMVDQKNLDGIQFSAENLLGLINDILDFSKIEAGKLTLQKTDFNLHELISNVSRGFKIKADEKGLGYKMKIESLVPKFIIGDQLRLNQILINLLGNAIKFTHEGEISIEVSTKNMTSGKVALHFQVKDTGIGIPEDKLNSIFESFYQVHKPGKNKIEGTGLGLSISKQLIEMQGGTLIAKSKPGKGSSFEFTIEYEISILKRNLNHQKGSDNQQKHSEYLSGLKVLVVEDNKMNQFFIQQLLSNWNVGVQMAENGKIAVELVAQETYDLILMDMHMPVMDGPEAAALIRASKNPKTSQVPIIACSADVFPESKRRATESGMDFYLTKPINENELEEILLSLKPNTHNSTIPKKDHVHLNSTPDLQEKKVFHDLSFLKKTFDNDTEIIHSVLQIFLDATPTDYQKLSDAIASKDHTLTQQFAHKLKSSFKTIGLTNQASLLQTIETAAREEQKFDLIQKEFENLDQSYPNVIEEIKKCAKDFTPSNS
ncbi:ATP-binding protein [Aquimarina spongiae]|uniref:histidine kinase n=1 Tax=Aquimarina spongiae TaxID=570521 RepID=A0A1M6K029_9FLAO|nr:ATP-binding protein [Aquimarina spongiae]SHJ52325.1 PAS domain S-box-containing protein [Aquimarina spongiae]